MQGGAVDYASLGRLIDYQIKEGVQGLVAVGTTGESPTLDYDEHIEVIRFTIERTAGRVPVIAGTGSNSTDEQTKLTKLALAVGAQAFLLVAPYYNKPSQEGLYRHFAAAARLTDKPIILYSVPGRCVVDISVATVKRLRKEFPHIIGLKDSGGTMDRMSELSRELDKDFIVLSGDDSITLPLIACGARGVISVASNLAARLTTEMVRLALKNDLAGARELHLRLYPLFKNLFLEPNPVPTKYALYRAGIIASPDVRLPLCEMSDATRPVLDATLRELKFV
jgi:4-hydroxy-tetrahydrodipicolinate synthase